VIFEGDASENFTFGLLECGVLVFPTSARAQSLHYRGVGRDNFGRGLF